MAGDRRLRLRDRRLRCGHDSRLFVNGADNGADFYGRAGRNRNPEDTGCFSGDFQGNLVGFQFADRFVPCQPFAILLKPPGDERLEHRFAHFGNFDFHILSPL